MMSFLPCLLYCQKHFNHPHPYIEIATAISDNQECHKYVQHSPLSSILLQLFIQNGYFDSELGNTMVLGLSNALSIPFIVFSSMPYNPVIHVTPRNTTVPVPIYVAYNYGHYHAVVHGEQSANLHHKLILKFNLK